MKKKLFFSYLIPAILGVILASCGGDSSENKATKQKEISVKPQEVKISGTLGEYVEIIDGTYNLVIPPTDESYSSNEIELKLKLKFIKKYPENKLTEEHPDRTVYKDRPEMKLDFLDENSMPVSNMPSLNLFSQTETENQIVSLLKAGNGECIVSFKMYTYEDEDIIKALADSSKVKTFTVSGEMTTSGYRQKGGTESSTSETNVTEVASDNDSEKSATTEDWDKVLTKYEKFANDYIALLKKINALQKKGDNASISEMSGLVVKSVELNQDASDLGNQLDNAGSDLTPAQMAKFTKIQLKFTQAAIEMSM